MRSEFPTTKLTVPVAEALVVTLLALMAPPPLTRPAESASVIRFGEPVMSPPTRITLPGPAKVRFIVCAVVELASPFAKLARPPPADDMVEVVVASATASTLMSFAAVVRAVVHVAPEFHRGRAAGGHVRLDRGHPDDPASRPWTRPRRTRWHGAPRC